MFDSFHNDKLKVQLKAALNPAFNPIDICEL